MSVPTTRSALELPLTTALRALASSASTRTGAWECPPTSRARDWLAGARARPQQQGLQGLRQFSSENTKQSDGADDDDDGSNSRPRLANKAFTWRVNHMVSIPNSLDGFTQSQVGEANSSWKSNHMAITSRYAQKKSLERAKGLDLNASIPPKLKTNVVIPRPQRIILIRHGESEGNRDEHVYTNQPDWKIGLTTLGKMQSMHAGRRLHNIVGDGDVYIYHSPYMRAVESTAEIIKALDTNQIKSVREEPRIAEQQFGNLRDFDTIMRCKEERKVFGRFFYRFPDGEAGLDVYNRVTSFIGTLRRDHLEMIGAENAPTTTVIGRSMLRKEYTSAFMSSL